MASVEELKGSPRPFAPYERLELDATDRSLLQTPQMLETGKVSE